jgi:RNA polymerase-binding transcription factor DksA
MALREQDIQKYRQVLEEKHAQIEKQVIGLRKKIKKSLDEDSFIERNSGDPDSDFITESSEIEKDEMLVHQLETVLEQINDAIEAIDEGYYGICQKCGASIDKARLNTIPWAKFCYKCQVELEEVDKGAA